MKSSSGSLAKMACVAAAAVALCVPIAARATNPMYLVYLNPFEVQRNEQAARDRGYLRPELPIMLRESEQAQYVMQNLDSFSYSPGVEMTRNEIVRDFGLHSVSQSPLSIPAFFARLNKREIEALKKSGRVVSVDAISADEEVGSFSYSDIVQGGEIIPWGKQAVGANDVITPGSDFYIVDSPFFSPALAREINMRYTDDNSTDTLYSDHAATVLSIAVGRANSFGIRGINPGQSVVHLSLGTGFLDEYIMIEKISAISSISEWLNQFATLSLSFNTSKDGNHLGLFAHDKPVGKAIRRASGRLFITQSAGNKNLNACLDAFGYNGVSARENDGVMVVGGTNRFGDRYPETPNPKPFSPEPRSNYGPCVEAWAPGSEMTTILANGEQRSITGTSYSAPIVAAIASRYGNSATRPIEREAYIRDTLTFTGKYEGAPDSNLPIRQVKYKPVPSVRIPFRLPVAAVYSKTHTANLQNLVNGKFYDGMDWNAHGGWGSIVLDLGSPRNIRGVRVMIRSSSDGGVLNFAVHGGNAISMLGDGRAEIPANPIAYKNTTDQFDLTPYYIPASGNYRYIMLEAANMASWLSYSEVEVYGY